MNVLCINIKNTYNFNMRKILQLLYGKKEMKEIFNMRKYLIGIDLGGTNIKSSIFTSNFEKVAEYRMSTQAEKGSEIVLLRILESIQELFSITNINASEILCIGIGVPGLLDNKTGISKFSPNFPKWENVHVSE